MDNKRFTIAIDGPAGAGKSTVAKRVAEELNIEYIDTGAMYRALTLKVLQNNLNPQKPEEVISLLDNTTIDFNDNHIYLDDIMVDEKIRENVINKNVSYVAAIKEVREGMVKLQQKMAERKSIIMDGRDIGTVVLPNADYKFFVTATVEERARRRYNELLEKGEKAIDLQQMINEIQRRDNIDSTREVSPLKKAEDAYLIDTTDMSIEDCVKIIISMIGGR